MALSTNLISGLSSGFDWRTMIDQLMELEHRPVDLVEIRKTEYEDQLSEWQSFNTQLLSLKTAASNLKDPTDFYVYTSNMTSDSATVGASDLLSVSTTSTAAKGTYSVKVTSLAMAQKLSSASFSDYDEALGNSYAGDILINGTAINISETDDLAAVRNKINNANAGTDPTGVTASIITYGTNDHRIVLNSDDTGEDGIGLQNGSSSDLVELFGWKDKTDAVKNSITGGAQSDIFTSTTRDIKTLLGLSSTQSGTVTIDGTGVAIDLSSDSLEDIKTAINDASIAGVTASIVTDTSGSTTTYRLQIDGTQTFTDAANILETVGVLENGVTDVKGTTSDNTMTVDGSNIIFSTLLTSIDGYNSWTSGDEIAISGTDHSGAAVSDTFSITSSSTVQDLMDAIASAFEANHADRDVSVYTTSNGKIEIADMETGGSSLAATLSSTITNGALDWGAFTAVDTVRSRELVAAADATVEVDGVEVTSSDNTVDDVLPGVTLNLLKADLDTTVTLNVNRDIDALMEKFTAFVDAYNEVSAYINQQQEYDEDEEEIGGVLFGDGTLSSVKTDLSTTLIESVWGVSSEYAIPGLVGINLDNEGQLSIDTDTLRGYLQTNFNDIRNLFAANGTTSAGTLEYLTSTRDSEAGEYTVNITQAATQSITASDTAVGGTLGADETLTITQDDKTATISLTSDMTISDIINAVNTELDTVYTEILIGDQQLYEGSGESIAMSSTTTWDQVYVGANSANLADGDVISFTGTSRSGGEVTGSYTIDTAASDTVQGLLNEIESAYGNDVDASIDSSGKLVITDESSGGSDLSISLDYSQAHDLTFGASVSTTNTGGQEGRYAMDITASNSGSDELVLTYDNYGSGHSFTISEDTDTGLWTGSQTTPVTTTDGLDVTGTINGESATGSGRTLTGDDDETNIGGLAIKYTGTTTGDIGTIKLILGMAELFDRVLFNITDSYDGYVAFKQDSLQDNIERLETRIEDMEDRLDAKMERMINKFVAMEIAMSRIQSQSQWLSGQLDAAANGWWR
ncbi:MAG: flagellar hook protein [Desulfobacterales bacterium S7086C20]|nr:MAG: flagellar hook protein [Desulfobacterales bacterium S7086C20]